MQAEFEDIDENQPVGSVARTTPHSTHDHTTKKRSSSRISNVSAPPQVGQTRGSGTRGLTLSAYVRLPSGRRVCIHHKL